MIKTLRITSVVAVFLTIGILTFSVVFGICGSDQVEQVLGSPSVVDKFRTQDDRSKVADNQMPPLVQQAKDFALYLNPPPVIPKLGPAIAPETTRKPTVAVAPKFELIGISFCAARPDMSLALIDEPGKGFRWVRPSAEIGHIVIDQIRDGIVVVRDGGQTIEMQPKKQVSTRPAGQPGSAAPTGIKSPVQGVGGVGSSIRSRRPPLPPSGAGLDAVKRFLGGMKQGGDANSAGQTDAQRQAQQELMKLMTSDLESAAVSPQEVKILEDMAVDLENAQPDPNQPSEPNTEPHRGPSIRPEK